LEKGALDESGRHHPLDPPIKDRVSFKERGRGIQMLRFFYADYETIMENICNYSGQLLRVVARSAGDIDFPGTNSIRGASASPAPPGFSEARRRIRQSRSYCDYAPQPN